MAAIKRILYATDDDVSVVGEAQAMVAHCRKEVPELLSPIAEVSSEEKNSDNQKRKSVTNVDLDAVGVSALSPRQRLCDATDVHCSGSPLMTY